VVALVTGSHGFLGRAISAALATGGWTVTGAGRPEHEIPSPEFDELLQAARPSLVVHCAGPASVPASVADPDADRAASVGVTAALLEGLQALSPSPRLILISSAAVYGQPRELPIAEGAPYAPISPYGRHRVECEGIARSRGLPAVVLRIFSAYGEGLRRQVLWDIAQRALAGGPIELLGSGEESRDFVHASDVGRALLTAAQQAPFDGEAYNLASGVETPIAELAEMLVDALGVERRPVFTGIARSGDPVRWCADIAALRALGFEPQVPLEEGVARYATWVRTAA
jgi:UDP-glucose 4-epimerase